jgi:chromosome segregation ATPase
VARHLRITCPSCRRSDLRIRPEMLGFRVACKHCGHAFHARIAEDPATTASPSQAALVEPAPTALPEEAELDVAESGGGLRSPLADHAARDAESPEAPQDLREARDQVARLGGRVQELVEQPDQAREHARHASAWEDELAETRSEVKSLLLRIESLRGRAAEADSLEETLETRRTDLDLLREAVEEARSDPRKPNPRGEMAIAQELDAVRAERDLLRKEAEDVRAELKARTADVERFGPILEELQVLSAERYRLDAECQEGSRREEWLEARLNELERTLSEATDREQAACRDSAREFEEARGRWEARSETLRAEVEACRAQIREAEQRIGEERAQAEAERRDRNERVESARAQIERERHDLQLEGTRLRLDAEAARRETGALARTSDDLAARLAEAEAARNESERRLCDREVELKVCHQSLEALRLQSADLRGEIGAGTKTDDTYERSPSRAVELTEQLREVRLANERLRSLLNAFGLVRHLGEEKTDLLHRELRDDPDRHVQRYERDPFRDEPLDDSIPGGVD